MCGVIGLIHERHRDDLGVIAGELLRALEYRGYDSTGAAIQGDTQEVELRKDVGAPSRLVTALGIDKLGGRVLCGQVRWATFGAVDQKNAQPHVVRCKTFIYGAHNGNVTNCDALKSWLESEGHEVRSDNDGEVLVHTVEHFFALELEKGSDRRAAMRAAIVLAGTKLRGSYAAVIVDPVSYTLYGIKKGSSFYFGAGELDGSRFGIASSDLSAVLRYTRVLLPLSEGEFVEFAPSSFTLHRLSDGAQIERKTKRSRLRAEDTALKAPFTTFMEQEIAAQVETTRSVIGSFQDQSESESRLSRAIEDLSDSDRLDVLGAFDRLREQVTDAALERSLAELTSMPVLQALVERTPELRKESALRSSERGLLADLVSMAKSELDRAAIHLFDARLAIEERTEMQAAVSAFVDRVIEAKKRGGRVFILSCGSSFHAAKTASLFFNQIARTDVLPLLPGELRGQYGDNVRDGDVLISVSQSGETKDLIDVINDVIKTGREVTRIALVNNVNSTLAQEKSDIVIPLRCGPEIAVAATKSFINQLTVFYCLAIALASRTAPSAELDARKKSLSELPELIERTLVETDRPLDETAKLLFLRPSIHILAARLYGIAKEGALKIREVVLNHTEGFEASEFKHGPNTILGLNTVFGLDQLEHLVALLAKPERPAVGELISEIRSDYPLVYLTGPDPRDVDLTISQINTHKIRGASTIVIAEDESTLRLAAEKPPADNPRYRHLYVALPKTGDPLLTAFSATVTLQRLALKMSLKKQSHLDALGLAGHGVHPDVPKNVSKSITVD
jgi:glutamine---fructose-6-phosphate transaminase (isomerizing)